MNFRQIQDESLGALRQPLADSHRRQLIRGFINNALNDILSKRSNWSFLNRKATILSVNGDSEYAVPIDLAQVQNIWYGGARAEVFKPLDEERYNNVSGRCVTIRTMTSSPFANVGYAYPTYGSKTVIGQGTAFTSDMVGRFFKASRDGEIYKIKAVNSTTQLTLCQDFKGRSIAGLVDVNSDALTTVVGSPYYSNFKAEMIGRYIRIASANYQISNVDVDRQRITVASNIATIGSQLAFSINDNYEIDPPGTYILEFFPTPDADDEEIRVDYQAYQLPLTGDNDVPALPERFHRLISYRTIMLYGAIDGSPMLDLSVFREAYREGLLDLMTNEDPLDGAYDYNSEPDVVRLQQTTSVR